MNSKINFLYFLYNHSGMEKALIDCFGNHLGNHFNSKLKGADPKSIINLMMEMSDDNKETFFNWIDRNYNYKEKNSPL